jgi:uncharacterized protein YjlB
MIEQITRNNQILAIIIKHDYSNNGIAFFTPNDFSQQLAYMNHQQGKIIQPHVHNIVKREVLYTKEVLVIKKGKVRTDIYTDDQEYVCSRILESGDIILLAAGGHGFEMLEDTEMFEVKQGPYAGKNDKTRFEGIDFKKIGHTE